MTPSRSIFLVLVTLAVGLEVVADILLKKWSIELKWGLLAIGLLVYFVGTVGWAFSLRYEYLSRAIAFFTVMNLVILTLVGTIVFHEQLTWYNKLGILLGIVSILLIEI